MELQAAEDAIKARLAAQDRQLPPFAPPHTASAPNQSLQEHFSRMQPLPVAANKRMESTDEDTPFGTDRNAKV